jgi:hypothetical protein
MNKPTGGPAFPLQSIGPEFEPGYSGMTLRDYFAAKVLQGFCAGAEVGDDIDELPKLSYMMADAMLKARESK